MFRRLFLSAFVVSLGLFLFLTGCSKIPYLKDEDPPQPPTHSHFNDILVPSEMKIDRESTFVFETQGFKAGTLHLTGYVDVESITDFFRNNMPKDGWSLKSVFRHPKTMLLFEKERKTCIISVYEKTIMTHAEIYVAPTVQ
ncbi:MAG: hypothetical protein HQK55_19265 [Deltaproteobacteria bacterium]|nr:hypothetical protein [Deltaproteobacteria bacterium]